MDSTAVSLFCPECHLPVVPFGGEAVCTDPSHVDGYREDGRDDDEDLYRQEDEDQ